MEKIKVEYLYLDNERCGRCKKTEENLENALAKLEPVLATMGTRVDLKKTQVTTEEKARQLNLKTSPTIRVNGKDIQPEIQESCCDDCGDLCGDDVDCRIWTWRGQTYEYAPEGLIIEAIMKEISAGPDTPAQDADESEEVPENLRRFFAGRGKGTCGYGSGCC